MDASDASASGFSLLTGMLLVNREVSEVGRVKERRRFKTGASNTRQHSWISVASFSMIRASSSVMKMVTACGCPDKNWRLRRVVPKCLRHPLLECTLASGNILCLKSEACSRLAVHVGAVLGRRRERRRLHISCGEAERGIHLRAATL